jgi:hypothetical protein
MLRWLARLFLGQAVCILPSPDTSRRARILTILVDASTRRYPALCRLKNVLNVGSTVQVNSMSWTYPTSTIKIRLIQSVTSRNSLIRSSRKKDSSLTANSSAFSCPTCPEHHTEKAWRKFLSF